MLLFSACSDDEKQARADLARNGYTEIELLRASDGFEFRGKKGSRSCSGRITMKSKPHAIKATCVEVELTERPATCPDVPSVCFDEGVEATVEQDFPKAVAKYSAGCEAGDSESCAGLGGLYQTGRGVPRDVAKAKQLLEKACSAGAPQACAALESLK